MTATASPSAPTKLELPPLRLGNLTIDTPVVLAPMAGITNKAFRRLCREYGGGLYVTEMVTSRALVERNEKSMRIISHDDDEKVRSVQLYGVDPRTVGAAVTGTFFVRPGKVSAVRLFAVSSSRRIPSIPP